MWELLTTRVSEAIEFNHTLVIRQVCHGNTPNLVVLPMIDAMR
jgi:hypothetical protein